MSSGSHSSGRIFWKALKMIVVGVLKIALIAIAFVCRIVALVLNKIAEILDKFAGYGQAH